VKTADSPVVVTPHDFEDIVCRARTMRGRLTKCSQVKLIEGKYFILQTAEKQTPLYLAHHAKKHLQ